MIWENGSFIGSPLGAIFPSPDMGWLILPWNRTFDPWFSININGWSAKRYWDIGALARTNCISENKFIYRQLYWNINLIMKTLKSKKEISIC